MTLRLSAPKRPSLRARAGFTLIELLVVVVIIGILASVAMPGFGAAQDRARNGAAVSGMNVVRQGLEVYSTDHQGSFPSHADLMTVNGLTAGNYLPGNQNPKCPWSPTRQLVRIAPTLVPMMTVETLDTALVRPTPGMGFRPPVLGSIGNPPALGTHYGAMSIDTEDGSVGNRTRYVITITGKDGKNAVIAGWTTNGGR